VWVLLGGSFPNRIRAAALSLAAAAQWAANWVISTAFSPLKDAGLGLAYGLYTNLRRAVPAVRPAIRPRDQGR
jgi:MFS transporter, SP family, sugar:H+ symporter